ncbi:MAG: hypothetical protein Q8P30_02150 [Candidatus Uhrbacteria bacterium]|nr:hypothetical protein [Candidatus Uhrbacteria bacterium]
MTITSAFYKTLFIAAAALLIGTAYFVSSAPEASALTSLSSVDAGDLIRGEAYSAVYYYGADGFRYVFPNSNTYFTWYDNFDTVIFISDADLATIQIGGNVTYKPGVKMIKIQSDPRTYAVAPGGTLRHVGSEAIATAMYGASWNTMIDDLADGFFTNYTIGTAIASSSDFVPATVEASVSDIGDDKELVTPEDISITDSGYTPLDVTINPGAGVRFTNNGSENHTATADDLSWGSGTISPGGSFIRTFNETGTYGFFDSYDSTNSGAVYVD